MTEVLGLRPARDEPEFSVYRLPDGDVLEILGPRAEIEAKGVLFIGPIHSDKGFAWSHFFAPDGHVYEITSSS